MSERIPYDNKVALNEREELPEVNKWTADNINSNKYAINSHADDIESLQASQADSYPRYDTVVDEGDGRTFFPVTGDPNVIYVATKMDDTDDNGNYEWDATLVDYVYSDYQTPVSTTDLDDTTGRVAVMETIKNYTDGKIDKEHKRTSVQLFEYTTMIPYVDMSISSGGDLVSAGSSVGYKVTEIIIDEDATDISFGGFFTNDGLNYRSRFVDENGDYVSGSVANNFGSGNSTKVFTASIPVNAAKFQFTILRSENIGEDFTTTMVNFGDEGLDFEPYTSTTYVVSIDGDPILSSVIKSEDNYYSSVNQLFDKDTMQINDSVIDSSGNIIESEDKQVLSVPLFNYTKSTPMSISGIVGTDTSGKWYSFLNADGNVLYHDYFRSDKNIIYCPIEGAVLLNATIKVDADPSTYADDIMLNYGNVYLEFETYVSPISYDYIKTIEGKELFPDVFASNSILFQKPFYGQKVVTIGDSITYQCRWQFSLTAMLNVIWSSTEVITGGVDGVPMGVGGSTIKPVITGDTGQEAGDSIYYRADYVDSLSPDVIVLMGGQNDGFSTSYDIYETAYTGVEVLEGSEDAPTFTASYKGVLEKLVSQNPTAKIICLSPMYTKGDGVVNQSYFDDMVDRDSAISNIAKMYGCEFISMLNCGISRQNADETLRDGTHPNDYGGMLMSKYIYSKIS